MAYFGETANNKTYSASAKFFNILTAIGVITPVIAGAIGHFNFSIVMAISFGLFILALWVAGRQNEYHYSFSIKESLKKSKGAKTITILDGFYDSVGWGIITIFTLKFIHTPFEFGTFLSTLSIVSVFANHYISKIGEKYKKNHIVTLFTVHLTANLSK